MILQEGLVIPKYGVLAIRGNLQISQVQQKKVLVFREAPRLVVSNVDKLIGQPVDIEKNLEKPSSFESDIDLSIP